MNYYAMVDVQLQQNEHQQTVKSWNKDVRSKQLIKNVCEYYDVTLEDLKGRNRKAVFRDARNLTMYCLHKILRISCTEVGNTLNRDHATVLNGCKRVMDWVEVNKEYRQLVSTILNK